ncbi:AcrR family transcriptional regulator [Pseudorhizobium tarimense]|uniref:AcrR family transcriptional regulator n=1 Tax=Pseudorhizobium tarimense TaxID=1079109 RepID=A0ABV2H4P2_9HYPH|nr:TetR/AcrR family transcriptional regulator [Pseudorhizobium tarimense]MCJ8518689.1 TetR/AcrR family transcriptional regulator [Pseudorhizobium tarimense]
MPGPAEGLAGQFAEQRETVPPVQLLSNEKPSKGERTRQRILEITQASVLAKGFAATSIEEVIAEAGITKSGFFYHFRDKNELAREMLRRYVAENDGVFDEIFGRAAELTDDPLQRFLLGLKLLAELSRDLPGGHPGCLVASICYRERLFDPQVLELNTSSVLRWNARFLGYIEDIAAVYPPREPIALEDLARALTCIFDGAIIMAKALKDPGQLERQVLAYRTLVKTLFSR